MTAATNRPPINFYFDLVTKPNLAEGSRQCILRFNGLPKVHFIDEFEKFGGDWRKKVTELDLKEVVDPRQQRTIVASFAPYVFSPDLQLQGKTTSGKIHHKELRFPHYNMTHFVSEAQYSTFMEEITQLPFSSYPKGVVTTGGLPRSAWLQSKNYPHLIWIQYIEELLLEGRFFDQNFQNDLLSGYFYH